MILTWYRPLEEFTFSSNKACNRCPSLCHHIHPELIFKPVLNAFAVPYGTSVAKVIVLQQQHHEAALPYASPVIHWKTAPVFSSSDFPQWFPASPVTACSAFQCLSSIHLLSAPLTYLLLGEHELLHGVTQTCEVWINKPRSYSSGFQDSEVVCPPKQLDPDDPTSTAWLMVCGPISISD